MIFHHVGYAVHSLESAWKSFFPFFITAFPCDQVVIDEKRNIEILFSQIPLGPLVELIAPHDKTKTSPVDGRLQKTGAGPYHFCYLVEDMQKKAAFLQREKGALLVEDIAFAPALNSEVMFLYLSGVGLIELLQKKENLFFL